MTFLRSVLFWLILVIVVTPYCALVYCAAPLPRLDALARDRRLVAVRILAVAAICCGID